MNRIPIRTDLEGTEPYGAPQLDVPVRLNTNETAEPPPPEFLAALAARIAELPLHRYPDRDAAELRACLAQYCGRPPEGVWVANGSNEVLLQLLQAYGGPGRTVLLLRPGYSMYPLLARTTLTDVVEADLPDDLVPTPEVLSEAVRRHRPSLVVFANPNNPTGIAAGLDVVRAAHDAGDALVVVDEAYVEFGGPTAVELLDRLPRLVVVRTFSKAFRLAGLRLGYLLGPSWVVEDLQRVRLPYHLDAITQLAGVLALQMADRFLDHRRRVAAERDRVAAALRALGIHVYPSAANFLLFRVADAVATWRALLDRGVLVRDFSRLPRLDGCLRVTIGTAAENDAFLDAMREITAAQVPSGGER